MLSLKFFIFHSNSWFLSPSLNESEFLQSRKSMCQKIIRYFDFEIWQILTNSKEQFQHKSQNMEDSLLLSILYQKRYGRKKQKNLNLFTFLYKFQNYQPWQMLFFGLYLAQNILKNDPKITECCTYVWSYSCRTL